MASSLGRRLCVCLAALLTLVPAAIAHGAAAGPPPISISSVSGSFFPNPTDSGTFAASPTTPVAFTADFPVINFNAPVGTVACSNPTRVDVTTRPFTNVVPQADGSCKLLVAQGSDRKAGVGDLESFHAVFTGSFLVTAAGHVTFNFFSDDGWILSIGQSSAGTQPVYVSGPLLNFPKVGPFTGYASIGSYNVVSSPAQNNLVVNFPSGGSFPFELDYSECCGGDVAFTLTANGAPIPATMPLSLDVRGIANGGQAQGQQHIDVGVATGQAQQVELLVDNRSRGISRTFPFTFDWDTQQETPGPHKVIVRGTDPAGGTTDKETALEVVVPQVLGPAPVPTAVVVAAPAVPEADPNGPLLAVATVLLLILAGVGLFFLMRGAAATPRAAPVAAAAPVVVDRTEFIGRASLNDLTMIGKRRTEHQPKAKLLVKPDREVPLSRATETILGRDTSNAAIIEDRQASRQHAKITCEAGDFWIEDLNSTNGTRVNGVPIVKQKLVNNDQIGVGDAIVTFTVESA